MVDDLELLSIGVLVVDDEERVTRANRAAARLLGTTRGDLEGTLLVDALTRAWGTQVTGLTDLIASLTAPLADDESRSPPPFLLPSDADPPARRWVTPRVKRSGSVRVVELVDGVERPGFQKTAEDEHLRTERLLRAVYDTSPDVIFVHDASGAVVGVNERLQDVYGYAPEEILGKIPSMLGAASTADDDAFAFLRRAFAGEHVRASWRARHKSGREFPVEVRLRRLDHAEAPLVVATIRDLTEELLSADALRKSEERYRAMFEKNRAVKLLIDPENARILDVNPAAEELYGYSVEALRKMGIDDLNPLPRETLIAAMQRAKVERQSHFRFQHRHKDGHLIDVEVHSSPLELEGRTVLFSIIHDISAQKRLEEQLVEAQKMEALGRLAAGVAHDFNNLMQVVVASSELARSTLDDTHSAVQLLEDVRGAGLQAAALTRRLLAFGRRQVLSPRVLDLNQVLEQMRSMLRSVAGPEVDVQLSLSSLPACALADSTHLEQVILNLALNARDALNRRGTLTLRTSHTTLSDGAVPGLPGGEYVQLEVEDDGAGIAPEDLPRVFEPFFSSKPQGTGTGLGLSLVYGVVKQSGGHVQVESALGEGTTFTVLLPAVQPEARGTAAEWERTPLSSHGTALLVDDDDIVRRVVALMLEQRGWQVLSVREGEQALAVIEAHAGDLDVLITDVRMPGLSGRKLVERVRKLRPDIAVLYISGGTSEETGWRRAEGERVAFLQKPVSQRDLDRTLQYLLEGASY